MLLLRCTRKALTELGLPANEAYLTEGIVCGTLGAWYVNVFRYARRKCIIWVNETTLYTVVVPGVLKHEVAALPRLFRWHTERQLGADGFEQAAIKRIMCDYGTVAYGKTENRRVVGSMNDYVRLFGLMADRAGGFDHCAFEALNSQLNDTPMSMLDLKFPLKQLRAALGLLDVHQ